MNDGRVEGEKENDKVTIFYQRKLMMLIVDNRSSSDINTQINQIQNPY